MAENDPITKYQDALRELAAAEHKAANYAQYVADAGAKLQHWKETTFSNLGNGFPVDTVSYSIIGNQWPTAVEVAQSISDYHKAKNDAENAYRAIPEGRRLGVNPPPRD